MNRASNLIVFKILHLERLKNNTLASHSSVSVHNDGYDFSSLLVTAAEEMLLSAGAAHNDWVNTLEMGRIGKQSKSHVNLFTSRSRLGTFESGSQVVFDISGASIFCGVLLVWSDSLELCHNHLKGLPNDVCQNI